MSHPDLRPELVERALAELRAEAAPGPPAAGPAPEGPAEVPLRSRVKARVRHGIRPVAEPALDRLAVLVASRLRQTMRSEYDELAANVTELRARVDALAGTLFVLGAVDELAELLVHGRDAILRLHQLGVNLELMKGDLGAFRDELDALGRAIAPGAGIEGVPTRFAELRERVNALDRRLRALPAATPASGDSDAAPTSGTTSTVAAGDGGSSFDYVGFEQRFRGDTATILTKLDRRYRALLERHQPVLDFGCGRGELVAVLREHGVDAVGVDPDAGMVEEAQSRGLPVHAADGIAWLRGQPEHSLGSIISVHVVEHLELPALVEMLELAASRLRPGGILVAETPNPASLVVLGNSYILDPTHVWPLHPSLLTFLCERAGFRDVRLEFHEPATAYQLAPIEVPGDAPPWLDQLNDRFDRLNHTLFGPQEYAVVATTPTP